MSDSEVAADHDGSMRVPSIRIGTWNLNTGLPDVHRGAQADWLRENADVWMLTEVHEAALDGLGSRVLGGAIGGMPRRHWAGITSIWPLEGLSSGHPTLALARVTIPGLGRVLVASTVLPWRSAGQYWPAGDGDDYRGRFASTLSRHLAAILAAQAHDLVIWGGDFNQALAGLEAVGSSDGRRDLGKAFETLELRVLTEDVGAGDGSHAIDHLAVPTRLVPGPVRCLLPKVGDRALSDHPAYISEISSPRSGDTRSVRS